MRTTRTTPFSSSIAAALLAVALPTTALADDAPWHGFHVGGSVGGSEPMSSDGGRILFDTNLDGQFGDTVRTSAGADAFSPGFCGGAAYGRTPATGCREDSGGAETSLRAGYDWQSGRWVYGILGEYTDHDARDSVAAFSTTPALYTMTRELEHSVALRGRVGMSFGGEGQWLGYATAGAVRGRISNSFATSNTANAFTPSGSDDADGYQAGLGIERRVLGNLSIGLEYLYTRLDDDGARVRVERGTAPATNPFLLVNPAGTNFRRSDNDFSVGSLRLTANWRF